MEYPKKKAPWYQPETDLTEEETKAAYQGQISYPQIVKKLQDPLIEGQEWCCLSFMPLEKPVHGVSAFVKCRGCWKNDPNGGPGIAEEYAKKIVREVDSKFPIKIAKTGIWVPVTDSEEYDQKSSLVREDIETGKLQDDPIKAAEERHEKIIKELQERAERLKDRQARDDPHSDKTSIDYYCMRKVTMSNLQRYIEEGEEKIRELKKQLKTMNDELDDLDEKFPEHSKTWIDHYNRARKEVGLNEYDPRKGHNFL